MPTQSDHFIQGRSQAASDARTMDLLNPATEEVHGSAARGTAADIDTAVQAARAQFDGGEWSRLPGSQRGLLLNRLADLVQRDADMIADMDALCIGRPPLEPRLLDLPNAIGTLRTCAGWADKIEGRTIPTDGYMGLKTISYTRREAIGVVGAIVPWNTPFMIMCWKVGPALAAGCTLVVKPPEEAPLSALHLAALCKEAGFPDGVFNVVTGNAAAIGGEFTSNPLVRKLSFTGSTNVGRLLMQQSAGSWAARARRSCSTTPTSTWPCRAAPWACSSTRARSVPPAPASWCSAASPSASRTCSPAWPRPSRSATRRSPA